MAFCNRRSPSGIVETYRAFTIRVPQEVYALLRAKADKNKRSLAAEVQDLLEKSI